MLNASAVNTMKQLKILSKNLRLSVLLMTGLTCCQCTWAAEPLQGGIKDEAVLHPSLTVIPAGVKSQAPLRGSLDSNYLQASTSVIQLSGNHFTSGQPTYALPPTGQYTPQLNAQIPYSSYGPIRTYGEHGIIAPISTYKQDLRTNITSVGPQMSSTPSYSAKGITTWGTPQPAATPALSTHEGITTYVPGYEVKTVSRPSSLVTAYHCMHGNLPFLCPGHCTILPGYSATHQDYKVDSIRGADSTTPGSSTVVSTGNQVQVVSSREGVVTWAPGYEVKVTVPHTEKETLGGMWSTKPLPEALSARPGSLALKTPIDPVFVNIQRVPEEQSATALMLPQLEKANVAISPNWGDWYKQVARAIYSRWQYADVGVGTAVVKVRVDTAHRVEAQVVDFIPAEDVRRDVQVETNFRQTALKAANSVQTYDIPGFPPGSNNKSVSFDIELKRTADGPTGFSILSSAEAAKKLEQQAPALKQSQPTAPVKHTQGADWEL